MAELDDLLKEREALEEKIKEVSRRDRLEALNICREYIKKYDFSPAELGIKRGMRKGSAVPKYMGPDGETWAGRGRKPLWLQQAELEGKSAEDFKIISLAEVGGA